MNERDVPGAAKAKDHRARVTQILIEKAFTQLLRAKPIHRISVKELCEAAGINRGTFYAHYADLYDLLAKMEARLMADLQRALEPLLAEDAQEPTLLALTSVIFRCLKENEDICAITLGPHGDREFTARLLDMARERCLAVYARRFDATPRPAELLLRLRQFRLHRTFEKWAQEDMATGAEEIAAIASGSWYTALNFSRRRTCANSAPLLLRNACSIRSLRAFCRAWWRAQSKFPIISSR